LKLRYLGHSAFHLEAPGLSLLFDPFLTGNPICPVREADVNANYIVLSHYHGDHLGDTVAIARRCGATVITTFEIAEELERQGCAIHDMHLGGTYRFDFGSVRCVPALHGAGISGGQAAGFVVTTGGKSIYHAGDTALFSDMRLLTTQVKGGIDVALLPIGDNYTMGPDDAALAAEWIKPRIVVPMHWGTYPVLVQDPAPFIARAARTGETKPVLLRPGETLTL
jgi:L-ascorbate metabolism protein UlaG (beta-lactamase superfamily)